MYYIYLFNCHKREKIPKNSKPEFLKFVDKN